MNHPGVWILGDLADDDRGHGMGVVVEYAGHNGRAAWIAPKSLHWNCLRFAKAGATAPEPGLTLFHCHQRLHRDFGFMILFDYM
jgi:FtsP/CotA-like multicopper oxidase with cupredoxin domain